MFREILRVITLSLAVCLLIPRPIDTHATTIEPLLWQQLVIQAGFVGIVECVTAGGIVARYKVIESWEGPKPGTQITISVPGDYFGWQFPVALCGERYLVTALRSGAPLRIRKRWGDVVPLWWRAISTDYTLPPALGRVPVIGGKVARLYRLGSQHKDLISFKRAVMALLALPAEQQELALLKALTIKYAGRSWKTSKGQDHRDQPKFKAFHKAVQEAKDVNSLLETRIAQPLPVVSSNRLVRIFERGGPRTLKFVKNKGAKALRMHPGHYRGMVNSLERRVGPSTVKAAKDEPQIDLKPEKPTREKLATWRRILFSEKAAYELFAAFKKLTLHDPAWVADYLKAWENTGKTRRDSERGYLLGSYFAWRCGKDRQTHLRTLLKARDPYVRVAAAAYLCFEDEKGGKEALWKFTKLSGDPGAWAALTLARRGDKAAMPRLLQVFQAAREGAMAGIPHRNLQNRAHVLLSNSAANAKLALPRVITGRGARLVSESHRRLEEWWYKNRNKLTLHDPWLEILKKQKVD